jgi:ankyrin repeat protein
METPLHLGLHDAAERGDLEALQRLIEKEEVLVDSPDTFGDTALFNAAWYGHFEAAEYLIQHGANVNAINFLGITPVEYAYRGGTSNLRIIRLLAQNGASLDSFQETRSWTRLHLAVVKGSLDAVTFALSDENLNVVTDRKESPLLFACLLGDLPIAKLLYEKGGSVRIRTAGEDWTCSHFAALAGHAHILRWLIDLHLNVDSGSVDGSTPLRIAAVAGHLEAVNVLLQNGANVTNTFGHLKSTLLHDVAGRGHVHILQRIIIYFEDSNVRDSLQRTAMHLAATFGHVEIGQVLVAHGADINAKRAGDVTPLHLAAASGRMLFVEFLLHQGCDILSISQSCSTPLHFASENGHANILKLLVEFGFDVNAENADGYTPLTWSVSSDNLENTKYLCWKGANENIKDKRGRILIDLANGPCSEYLNKHILRKVMIMLVHSSTRKRFVYEKTHKKLPLDLLKTLYTYLT